MDTSRPVKTGKATGTATGALGKKSGAAGGGPHRQGGHVKIDMTLGGKQDTGKTGSVIRTVSATP